MSEQNWLWPEYATAQYGPNLCISSGLKGIFLPGKPQSNDCLYNNLGHVEQVCTVLNLATLLKYSSTNTPFLDFPTILIFPF